MYIHEQITLCTSISIGFLYVKLLCQFNLLLLKFFCYLNLHFLNCFLTFYSFNFCFEMCQCVTKGLLLIYTHITVYEKASFLTPLLTWYVFVYVNLTGKNCVIVLIALL